MLTMADDLATRPSLLVRLRDRGDQQAWELFTGLYGPLVRRFARRAGLQDADAADLEQTVMQAVAGAIGRFDYDPRLGTFRGWLFGIVRRQVARWRAQQHGEPRGTGDTAVQAQLDQVPEPDDESKAIWESEYRLQRFRWAADRVREHVDAASWQAFWQTAVEGRSAAEVGAELGLSAGAVYTAKSRVLARVRREIDESGVDV